MRAILILFFVIILGINSSYAYELVLPKEKKSYVSTKYAFFVGHLEKNEVFSINDERVSTAPNGAFAHSVKLKDGENRIVLKSNYNTTIYKVYKKQILHNTCNELKELEPQVYQVKKDNTPLRSTPIDYGMNRISHLFEGTYLIINGEKGGFYRVFLSKDKIAWIDKDAVILSKKDICPEFVTMNNETFKNASKHTIEFTEKLPYTIDEIDDEIIFKIYNPIISENSIYTINLKKPKKYFYKTTLDNGMYTFKISELPKSENKTLNGLTVVVDAGHGGTEKGAIGCLGDYEKDINLNIANELKDILSAMGANVIMTRCNDSNVELGHRVDIAKNNNAHIFVSIHLNSIPDVKFDAHKHKGTSVYYYNKNSKNLANSVLATLVSELNTKQEGVKTASFAVIRPTEYVGILVEVAYMTNPFDSVLYKKEDFSYNTAKAIADGIMDYTNNNDKLD